MSLLSGAPSVATLSRLDQPAFVALLEGIFEHSPWVPERTWSQRPFADIEQLHASMVQTMRSASKDELLQLVRAHPELAGRAARSGMLTSESSAEQSSVGLTDAHEDGELLRLRALNERYRQRFGFPFIIAVRGRTRAEIMDRLEKRLGNSPEAEFEEELGQIERISWLRLQMLLQPA